MAPGAAPPPYTLHFQETTVTQTHPGFRARYSGANSLDPNAEWATTVTSTLYSGLRVWKGGEIYLDPELSGGMGLSGTVGVAGFPNGEAFRVSSSLPTIYVARFYLRQTFDFGNQDEAVPDGPNQLAESRAAHRLSLVLGRFSAGDIFGQNAYSADPRTQFLNWSLMAAGAWDYPADTRGYTYGAAVEYHREKFALRAGALMVVREPNGLEMDLHVWKAHALVVEGQTFVTPFPRPGNVRLLFYLNSARMGNYNEALAASRPPSVDANEHDGRVKYGFALSADQELTKDMGAFLRASWNDGHTETWMFTEIDHSLALGAAHTGAPWHRDDDTLGLALALNGISGPHRNYLAAGGLGFMIGDGALDYSLEGIVELYYRFSLSDKISLTGDYQFIWNPAYNEARGPVNVFGARAHITF